MKKVSTDDCWLFAWVLTRHGYGIVKRDKKYYLVHRLMYEDAFGEIPKGLVIDHLCKERSCVNPDHMEAVTVRENTLRGNGPAAINSRKTHCSKGHPYSGGNLLARIHPKGWRYRTCRACQKAS